MIIRNVKIFREDGAFREGNLYTAGTRIEKVEEIKEVKGGSEGGSDETVRQQTEPLQTKLPQAVRQQTAGHQAAGQRTILDGTGLYAIPGLIDIHFHGCAGADFCEGTEEAIHTIAAFELSQGITSICPATMTISARQIARICEAAGRYAEAQRGALFSAGAASHPDSAGAVHNSTKTSTNSAGSASYSIEATLRGINLEGPFISPAKKGAQSEEYVLSPDAGLLREWMALSKGLCKLVDIAPEQDGAMEFIDSVKDEIHVSLAHTTAGYDTAMEAFRRGADHITHLYNAMPGFSHRSPGVIGAGSDQAHVYTELICDGIHVHPSAIRAAFKLFGSSRIVLISDSIEATGLSDGSYHLGGQPVTVRGREARLADGTLAGSVTHLMDCLRFLVQNVGIPLATAVRCATVNPARSIGIYDEVGSLEPGKAADILLLDRDLKIVHIIHNGDLI